MNSTFTIGSGENLVSASTVEEKILMFRKLIESIVKIKHPNVSMRAILEDGSVGYFGYIIWSNDGGKTITINPTYLDMVEDSELKIWWDRVVRLLLDKIEERYGHLVYEDAENKDEMYMRWCDGVYKNWINN